MTIGDWHTFADPAFILTFKYPAITPQGYETDVKRIPLGEAVRVHLTSQPSKEIYFEVTRYPYVPVTHAYAHLKDDVKTRLKARVWMLAPTMFSGLPAFQFAFEWETSQRSVVFIPQGEALYRVLFDSRSEINMQIASTVEFWADLSTL
jgi:hypothetical protein